MYNKFFWDAQLTDAHTTSLCHELSDVTQCCHNGLWKPIWRTWVTGFLPEYVWCPGCEQHLSYCVYVNTWSVLCTCVILSDSCVYKKYVCMTFVFRCMYILKWFMSSTFDNCVKWYWPTPGWGTLHCVVCRQVYCFTGW